MKRALSLSAVSILSLLLLPAGIESSLGDATVEIACDVGHTAKHSNFKVTMDSTNVHWEGTWDCKLPDNTDRYGGFSVTGATVGPVNVTSSPDHNRTPGFTIKSRELNPPHPSPCYRRTTTTVSILQLCLAVLTRFSGPPL